MLLSKAVESAPSSGTERLYQAYSNQQRKQGQQQQVHVQQQQQQPTAAATAHVQVQQKQEVKPTVHAQPQVQVQQQAGASLCGGTSYLRPPSFASGCTHKSPACMPIISSRNFAITFHVRPKS